MCFEVSWHFYQCFSNCNEHMKKLEVLFKCSKPVWGLRPCIPNKLTGVAAAFVALHIWDGKDLDQ